MEKLENNNQCFSKQNKVFDKTVLSINKVKKENVKNLYKVKPTANYLKIYLY